VDRPFDVAERRSWVYRGTRGVSRVVFSFLYKIEAKAEEDLSPKGPAVILPKHQYWTDIPIVSLAFRSFVYFVAKKELFRYPGIRTYLSLLGGIPVDRKDSIRTLDSFKRLLALLRAGEKIVVFPEGTYVRDGVGPGKSRLVQMILRFQEESKEPIPFVPVGISYGRRVGWRRQVNVCVGSPLFGGDEADAASLTDRIMEEISRLCCMPRCSPSNEGR
jgi:1-acyl-sn-glycerol-3-phosphate acyltransferase